MRDPLQNNGWSHIRAWSWPRGLRGRASPSSTAATRATPLAVAPDLHRSYRARLQPAPVRLLLRTIWKHTSPYNSTSHACPTGYR